MYSLYWLCIKLDLLFVGVYSVLKYLSFMWSKTANLIALIYLWAFDMYFIFVLYLVIKGNSGSVVRMFVTIYWLIVCQAWVWTPSKSLCTLLLQKAFAFCNFASPNKHSSTKICCVYHIHTARGIFMFMSSAPLANTDHGACTFTNATFPLLDFCNKKHKLKYKLMR